MFPFHSLPLWRFVLGNVLVLRVLCPTDHICFVIEPSKCVCCPFSCWNICAEYSTLEPGKNIELSFLSVLVHFVWNRQKTPFWFSVLCLFWTTVQSDQWYFNCVLDLSHWNFWGNEREGQKDGSGLKTSVKWVLKVKWPKWVLSLSDVSGGNYVSTCPFMVPPAAREGRKKLIMLMCT